MLVIGLFLVSVPLLIPFTIKMGVRRSTRSNSVVNWRFDEKGLSGSGKGFEFNQSWESMQKACVNEAGLLIYPEKGALHWIPLSSFATPHDFAIAKETVFENVRDCKTI